MDDDGFSPFARHTDTRLRLLANGYEPVPITNHDSGLTGSPGKAPFLKNWQSIEIDEAAIHSWSGSLNQTGTGLRCGLLVGVDIDVMNPDLAAELERVAVAMLGDTPPRRIGRAPKILLPYRALEPFAKAQTPALFAPGMPLDGKGWKVELLGRGNQFVAFGTHPETLKPYEWTRGCPLITPFAHLPIIGPAALTAFLKAAEEMLRSAGLKTAKEWKDGAKGTAKEAPKEEPKPRKARGAGPFGMPPPDHPPTTRQEVESALAAVPNDCDWHDWVKIGAAIHAALGDAGEGLFTAWSAKSPRDVPENTRRKWSSFTTSPMKVQAATLFWFARQRGWTRPDEFWQRNPEPEPDGTAETAGGTAGTDSGTASGTAGTDNLPPILTTRRFMDTFIVPDYLVQGIIQRGRVHALTSPTGHGKTAVALFLACMIAAGRPVGDIEVDQAPVLFLAGENPDDLCARIHAACQAYKLDPDTLPLHVMAGNFPIDAATADQLRRKIDATGTEYGMIVGDSVAAYFSGDNENDNVQMGACARTWRVLTGCKGNPAILALAHPIKNPDRDNLLPRGGGAFIAEVDANLVLWAEGERETTSLHWAGKIRGADFQPVTFALTPVRIAGKIDAKGRPFVSVVAVPQSAEQAEKARDRATSDENAVLEQLLDHPRITIRTIAENCGWVDEDGEPLPSKVHRILKRLKDLRLARNWRGKWRITDAGVQELKPESWGE